MKCFSRGGTTLLGVPGWAALNCLYYNFGQALSRDAKKCRATTVLGRPERRETLEMPPLRRPAAESK